MSFQPPGKYAWDLWFAHDGKNQHIFYLQAEQKLCGYDPDKRHNLSTVGHAILNDGKFENVCREAVFQASTTDNTWDNLSIWTGSITKDPDSHLYLMYYTSRKKEDEPIETPSEFQRPQNIGLATSNDLISWTRHPNSIKEPLIANPGNVDHLDGVAWRDPYITKIGEYYYCLITVRLVPNQKYDVDEWDQGGAVAYLKSENLYDWSNSKVEILVASKHFYEMEVPQLISIHEGGEKFYYLIFCAQRKACSMLRRKEMPLEENQNGTYYLKSDPLAIDSRELPRFNQPARILTPALYAGKIINPSDTGLIIYGFDIGLGDGAKCGGIFSQQIELSLSNH